MKRIYIVVEGQTEQEFVNSIVAPYLWNSGIFNITPVLIRTSRTGRGGMVSYEHLCNTIRMLLASGKDDFIVTTFIDYFRSGELQGVRGQPAGTLIRDKAVRNGFPPLAHRSLSVNETPLRWAGFYPYGKNSKNFRKGEGTAQRTDG